MLLDATLRIAPSSLTVVWGANGAGKSTFLKICAGLMPPDRGSVELMGRDFAHLDPAAVASRVAWLGHEPALYLDLSATENLLLSSTLMGDPQPVGRVLAALASVGVAVADCHRPVRGFSRGMQQRTALARMALAPQNVWLLDEPATGLDADGVRILAHILDTARAQGRAIVVASHDFSFLSHADAWWQLRNGALNSGQPT